MALTESKSFASLGPTLLARKGGAKPAMRPQLAAAVQAPEDYAQDLEDLGWNDMGDEDPAERRETVVLALTPAPHHAAVEAVADEPEVVRQQRVLVAALDDEDLQQRAPAIRRAAHSDARRAAFTLRLDTMRHLKLRLASTVKGRSAQALVTAALDKFLAEIPEIDALAAQLKRD